MGPLLGPSLLTVMCRFSTSLTLLAICRQPAGTDLTPIKRQ